MSVLSVPANLTQPSAGTVVTVAFHSVLSGLMPTIFMSIFVVSSAFFANSTMQL